jgi:hypothetical protein
MAGREFILLPSNEFDGCHSKPVETGMGDGLTRLNVFGMAGREFIRG